MSFVCAGHVASITGELPHLLLGAQSTAHRLLPTSIAAHIKEVLWLNNLGMLVLQFEQCV
jgi:hypothetical protein